jgi:hypothetical protein
VISGVALPRTRAFIGVAVMATIALVAIFVVASGDDRDIVRGSVLYSRQDANVANVVFELRRLGLYVTIDPLRFNAAARTAPGCGRVHAVGR